RRVRAWRPLLFWRAFGSDRGPDCLRRNAPLLSELVTGAGAVGVADQLRPARLDVVAGQLLEEPLILSRVQSENPDVPVEDAFVVPAWFSQQKSWLEDPANSDSAVYNYPLLLRLR